MCSWNEWVDPSRLRPSAEAVRPSTAAAAHEHTPRRVEHAPHTAHEAPVRFSANRTVSQSYRGWWPGPRGRWTRSPPTSPRSAGSSRRSARAGWSCRSGLALERAGQAKQEAATAATELREAVEKQAADGVDSKTMAHSATQIERLQADARDLATDSSEMQNRSTWLWTCWRAASTARRRTRWSGLHGPIERPSRRSRSLSTVRSPSASARAAPPVLRAPAEQAAGCWVAQRR